MNKNEQHRITENDIERMAQSFGKPAPAALRTKVIARIDEIDRARQLAAKNAPTIARNPPSKSRGRDSPN